MSKNPKGNPEQHDEYRQQTQIILKKAIVELESNSGTDDVANVLLHFLVRVGNSWRSIESLDRECRNTFLIDACTLLRAIMDALIQATYILHDQSIDERLDRAKLYLDFADITRYKLMKAVENHDTEFTRMLKNSPHRNEGNRKLEERFNEIKDRYPKNNGRPCRNHWYPGDLRTRASEVGMEAEYDIFLKMLHDAVHSGTMTVGRGPLISANYAIDWASQLCLRLANLCVDYAEIEIGEPSKSILDIICSKRMI